MVSISHSDFSLRKYDFMDSMRKLSQNEIDDLIAQILAEKEAGEAKPAASSPPPAPVQPKPLQFARPINLTARPISLVQPKPEPMFDDNGVVE